jgi:ABC transport system ATP-binding/permease protein
LRRSLASTSRFRRERALGLSISAYLSSKAVVLGAVAVLQAFVLVALAAARQGGPFDAVVLPWPWLELATAVAAASFAATALGLLVSALAGRVELAMTVLPVLIVAEVILALGGVSPEIASKPVIKQLSYVASAQWGFSAAASTAGLNDLEPLNGLARTTRTLDLSDPSKGARGFAKAYRGEPRWDHTRTAWGTSMLFLLGLTVVTLAGTGLALRRADRRGL